MSGKIHFRSEVQDVALCGSDDTFWGTSVSLTTCSKCREILNANASSSGDIHYREPGNEDAGSYCGSLEENWTTSDGTGEVTCRTCQTKLWAVGAAKLAVGAKLEAELAETKNYLALVSHGRDRALADVGALIAATFPDMPASRLLSSEAAVLAIRGLRAQAAEAGERLDRVAKRAFEDGAALTRASEPVQCAALPLCEAARTRCDELAQKLSVAEALASRNASFYETEKKRADEAEAKLRQLRERVERAEWNLAGCSTYAMGYNIEDVHNAEMALPALDDVLRLARNFAKEREMNQALDASLAACRAAYSEKQGGLAQAKAALQPGASDAMIDTLRRLVIRAKPYVKWPLFGADKAGLGAELWLLDATASVSASEPFKGSIFMPQHDAPIYLEARDAFTYDLKTAREMGRGKATRPCDVTWGPGPLEGDCCWCGLPRAEHAGQIAAELALAKTLLTNAEKRREDDERRFNETLRACQVELQELRNRIETMRAFAGAWAREP